MDIGLDKLKKWINKDTVDEKKPQKEELSQDRKDLIFKATREATYREISKALQKHPGKYVVTDKPFSVAEKVEDKRIEDFDYDRNETYHFTLKAGKDETRVTTYTPVKDAPGLYHVSSQEYKNGKPSTGRSSDFKVITWDKLQGLVDKSQKLYQERKKSKLFYPDNMLATNDGKSFDAVKKSWTRGERALFDNMPPKKYTALTPENLPAPEKTEAFLQKRWFDRKKDKILGINQEMAYTVKPFSFVTRIDETIDTGLEPYAKLLATGKSWKKSPIDKEVTVYTFKPVSLQEHEEGIGVKSFNVEYETFRDGKSTGKHYDSETIDITWKNMKDMVDMERKIHDAHVKAGGNFYPPNTLLLKDDREFEDFKARTNRRVKNAKGIRRKEAKQKEMEI